MKRILLMVLYNLPFVPYWWFQLCYYAGHTDQIPEDKKYALLKKITVHANRGGRVKIKVYGKEHIPQERGFMFFPIIRDCLMSFLSLKPATYLFPWWQKSK